jgi:hypothetical protein
MQRFYLNIENKFRDVKNMHIKLYVVIYNTNSETN